MSDSSFLIVDANPINLRLVSVLLSAEGYDVPKRRWRWSKRLGPPSS